ncbi:DUF5947 family protein [Thermomonospora cellulosilytica]|uniref:Uncharacterized protein n=1 Tax=Thermomonospora cellulosilytica TaxID=1411118 RepID=A0A7W3MTL5_9ACTN|nr:DUF5947 family protein [Thermomonospora cellulosilytica]MBA9001627.1 hypothetical protein [Thermomonospora cellulosilytica]
MTTPRGSATRGPDVTPSAGRAALGRVIARGRAREATERCELCGLDVPERHAHVLDEEREELLCACRACALLFERDAAARGQYRLVPDRRVRLTGLTPAELGVPVGLAFFVVRPDGTVSAHYPSPLGATRFELDPRVWERVVAECDVLRTLRPSVEALLINTARGADEQWLVPIDDCHRLVSVVRGHWQGLSGGTRVWKEVAEFFARLDD